MPHLPSYLHLRGFWYKNLTFTIFAPYLLLLFFFTTTYLQRENLCKSILGLWYSQGYIFQPGIYGIIKGLFFNVIRLRQIDISFMYWRATA